MKTTVIAMPRISWKTIQILANRYAIRVTASGKKLLLRSECAEDLVRMLSAINIYVGE